MDDPMKNTMTREAITTLTAQGFAPTVVEGKHLKVRWRDANGRTHQLIMARSPSDHRASHNTRARLRRMLRGSPSPRRVPDR